MSTTRQADAIELLTTDHKEVKALFDDYKKLVKDDADPGEKGVVAAQICLDLTIHATVEEEIFYPAAREVLDEQDLLDEAEVEHATVKDLVAQIESMDPEDELFDAKVTVLGEYVLHHVKEEEGEMFPKLRKTSLDLATLGSELTDRKQALGQELAQEQADH